MDLMLKGCQRSICSQLRFGNYLSLIQLYKESSRGTLSLSVHAASRPN